MSKMLSALATRLNDTEQEFRKELKKTSSPASTNLRGAFDIETSLVPAVLQCMEGICPMEMLSSENEKVRSIFTPQIFVSTPHLVFSQTERGHAASLRYQRVSSKFVVVTPEDAMMTWLRTRQPGTHPSFATVWQAFKCMNEDQLQAYIKTQGKEKVWCGTVGQGDILFTPVCCIVAERSNTPFGMGVKLSFVSRSQKAQYEQVFNELQARNKLSSGGGELVQAVYTDLQ